MTLDDLLDLSLGDDQIPSDISMPRNKPQPQHDTYEMQPYNPFAARQTMQTFDERTFDRVVSVRKPKNAVPGQMWFTEGEFVEQVSLVGWNKQEQRAFLKRFRRIQMLATGELNSKIVDSRQERLMLDALTQKGRKDVVEGGNLSEREMWITSNQNIVQTLKQPAPQQPKGFVGSVIEGLTGRR